MKCPNCGRENPDIRLFCANCGELLPEKGEQEIPSETESDDDIRIYKRPSKRADIADDISGGDAFVSEAAQENDTVPDMSEDTDFYKHRQRARIITEQTWPEWAMPPQNQDTENTSSAHDTSSAQAQDNIRTDGDTRRQGAPVLGANHSDNGRPSTMLPQRDGTLSPDDFFEVKGQAMDFDEAPRRHVKRARHGSEFEDPESPSFVVRHMRGIVGLLLLIFTVAIFAIWAVTPSAQDTLAKLDLAWSATAYERLGLEAYQTGDFSAASHYFSQALSRDPDNEAYVTYAVNSYIELGNMENAASILRKGISAQPYNVQYYTVLMDIYSGYENLSDADKALIEDGYRRTGDSRLDYSQMED